LREKENIAVSKRKTTSIDNTQAKVIARVREKAKLFSNSHSLAHQLPLKIQSILIHLPDGVSLG
jgi:hypothetical protein